MVQTDAGKQPPVILLHGYPFDRSMWSEQIDFLNAHGYRAVAPDLLGPNETVTLIDASQTISTMTEMAGGVAASMDDLKIDEAVICGLSMGGYVAFEFMHLFPERVRALILAGTRAPADNELEKQGRSEQVEQMLAEGIRGIAEGSLRKLLSRRTLAEKPEVVARLREMILRADPQGAAAAQRGMATRRDYTADLATIDVPTLVIVGRDDPIRPIADAEFMHERIRGSSLEIVEDAAHMTNMEQPEEFNLALLNFLKVLH